MAHTIHTTVLRDLTPDDVNCGPLGPGRGWVDLDDGVTLHGTITQLRAVAVEIDRQLARLEVEHRIDQAATDEGDRSRGGISGRYLGGADLRDANLRGTGQEADQ